MWGILTELVGKDPLHHPRHNHLSFLLTPGPLWAAEGGRRGNGGSGRWEISGAARDVGGDERAKVQRGNELR